MSGTKNTRVQMLFQAWGKHGYTLWRQRKSTRNGGATDIVSSFVGCPISVTFFVTREPTLTIPEEFCSQRGVGWERGNRGKGGDSGPFGERTV
jgi:hypothetical protein